MAYSFPSTSSLRKVPIDDDGDAERSLSYNNKWELDPQYKGWVSSFKADRNKARCKWCDRLIDISSTGESALIWHAKRESTNKIVDMKGIRSLIGLVQVLIIRLVAARKSTCKHHNNKSLSFLLHRNLSRLLLPRTMYLKLKPCGL